MSVSIAKLLIPALGIGALAIVAGSGNANAKSESPKDRDIPPSPELIREIQAAIATADPSVIRKTADKVEKAGYPAQAASMRAAAVAIETSLATTPGLPTPSNPLPLPNTRPPVVITTPGQSEPIFPLPNIPGNGGVVTPTTTDEQRLAGRMALDLATARVRGEDKALVTAYQAQEKNRKFYVGNLDGLYGPKTALALANDQHIIPPKPRYWPKNNMPKAKAEYKRALLEWAQKDASRAEEWVAAAQV